MKLFGLLTRKKNKDKSETAADNRSADIERQQSRLYQLEKDLNRLEDQTATIHAAIKQLQEKTDRHDESISANSGKIQTLEQRLSSTAIKPATNAQQPNPAVLATLSESISDDTSNKMNMSGFSPQEKRLLSVFFNNRDMHLSYADIGKTLNKSPHTIKNQLRQVRMKANLFDQTITEGSRKRFKLKDGLRIKNYLDVNQPTNPAKSTAGIG